jgi:hypothetical protein
MGCGIGNRSDDLKELEDRAWPAMGHAEGPLVLPAGTSAACSVMCASCWLLASSAGRPIFASRESKTATGIATQTRALARACTGADRSPDRDSGYQDKPVAGHTPLRSAGEEPRSWTETRVCLARLR